MKTYKYCDFGTDAADGTMYYPGKSNLLNSQTY